MINFSEYINYIDQPVIITDMLYQVNMMNEAFSALFPHIFPAENIHVFFQKYPVLRQLFEGEEGQRQVTWHGRAYTAHISFIRHGGKKVAIGRAVLLADITETERLVSQAETANKTLVASNEQLHRINLEVSENIRMEQDAAAYRETNALLRDLHDTLGHTLTVVNALQSLAGLALPDEDASRPELVEALRYVNISLAEMQSAGRYEDGGVTAFLQRFAKSMDRVGLTIMLKLTGEERPAHRRLFSPIMRIFQETATNSIRHGGASKLDALVSFQEGEVSILFQDNGTAPDNLKKGNGLIGMEERVFTCGGTIQMGKGENGGFRTEITLYVNDD